MKTKKTFIIIMLTTLFLYVGCGNRIDNLLNQMEEKITEVEDFCKKDAAGEFDEYDYLDNADMVANLFDDIKNIGAELTQSADYMSEEQAARLLTLMEKLQQLE